MGVPLHEAQRALTARLWKSVRRSFGRSEGEIVPLSAAQRQIWPDATPTPHAPLPTETVMIHRRGPFDAAILEAALNALVQRHEALRTSVGFDGGEPVQIIYPDAVLRLAIDDVAHLPEADRETAAITIATADAAQPIDLAVAPLLRARLIRLAEDDHRLALIMHPILFDAVAFRRVLLPGLAELYAAYAAGTPPSLPARGIDYGDYALWHGDRLEAGGRRRQLAWWREILVDVPPRFDPVGDRPRPALPIQTGAEETILVPPALSTALDQFAAARDTNVPIVMLAAFTALLHRQSGEQDIVIGGLADLRRIPALHDVFGNFRNIIALRARLSPDLPFDAHLQQVGTMATAAFDAAEIPFADVLRALDLSQGMRGHPLFSILFSIEPVEPVPTGWEIDLPDTIVGGARFDLHLAVEARPDGMAARFLYSPELFDRATIRRMGDQLLAMLEGVVTTPDATLGTLPLMTDDEAHAIAGWNATSADWPERTLVEMIAAQARWTPDAPAVSHDGQTWDYRTLDARADAIAARLAAVGIGRGSLVAIALDRSPELVASLLGTGRAGAAYLPLDAGQPFARIARIIADSAPDVLLTQRSLVDALPMEGVPVLLVDQPFEVVPVALPPPPEPDDVAYVIYTSGSTGLPKGVEISHRALANFICAMQKRPGFSARDSLLAVTAVTFDIAVLEFFLPLASGGRVIIAPAETSRDPRRLQALIAAERPSMI
jgi:non-ribosomal peptide synthetase component F